MTEPGSPEFEKARKRRNVIIAWSLVGFVALVFLVTMAKIKAGL